MSPARQFPSRSKLRSFDGCWTCRLRRKKCTENRPVCDECKALQITCHFQREKPGWMDGDVRQKEMADKIKADVKAQAGRNQSHGRRPAHQPEHQPDPGIMDAPEVNTHAAAGGGGSDSSEASMSAYLQGAAISDFNSSDWTPATDVSLLNPGTPQVEQQHRNQAKELHLLMIYVDYVFPYLFPHYRPPILAGGRRWILHVLDSNKSVHHTAVSLSSFFYAIALNGGDTAHEECTAQMAHEIASQAGLALRELQKELQTISKHDAETGRGERLMVMQSIIQMLYFEVATSNSGNWRLHLDAAVDVFLQLLPSPEDWALLLNDLSSRQWPPAEYGPRRPWSASQAALRFFTATIIYVDVISSITLGTPARLAHCHETIIPGHQPYERNLEPLQAGHLFVDEVFGLSNWVLRLISDVAALGCWKQTQKRSASLSVTELVSRGLALSDHIKRGMQHLEEHSSRQPSMDQPLFLDSDSMHGKNWHEQTDYQLIWLLATLSYLNVVISGWQPSNQDIRGSVSKATELLSRFPAGSCVQTLAWPLCVSGCLCAPEDEGTFRQLVQRMGGVNTFGSIYKASKVMEAVWSFRDTIDENWTMDKCFNILGFGVLLV